MKHDTQAGGSALAGVAIMAACACGAATGTVKTLGLAGIQTGNPVIHPIFVGFGGLLILSGLWRRSWRAGMLATAGLALLAIGNAISPPRIMSMSGMPHTGVQLLGFALYPVAAVLLVMAFMRAFPSPQPVAAATAMSGMALATGCSCCLVTGATSGLIGATGLGMPWVYTWSLVFFAGSALVMAGLWRLAGVKPALVAAAGVAITYGGPKLLRLAIPDLLTYSGVNFRFIPGYLVYLLGAAVMVSGFAVAYRLARREESQVVSSPLPEFAPASGD